MDTRLLIGILAAVVLVGAYFFFPTETANVRLEKILGKPAVPSETARLPQLAMQLEFDDANNRIISRQEDGAIKAWDIASGASSDIAATSGLFALCPAKQLLLRHLDGTVLLRDLSKGEERIVIEGEYHFASWDGGCNSFALANQNTSQFKLFSVADIDKHLEIPTTEPVRNGIVLSLDGKKIAVAEGNYDDQKGHDTKLEVFTIVEGEGYTRKSAKDDGQTVLGMWAMAFTPDNDMLIVPSQLNEKSGLRGLAAASAGEIWRKQDFESYWVRALATAPQGKRAATGDEKGWLRIWNSGNGVQLAEVQIGQVIQSLDFASDGKRLAVGLWDGTIGLMSIEID